VNTCTESTDTRRHARRVLTIALAVTLHSGLGCAMEPPLGEFMVHPGVEIVSVTGAAAGDELTLLDPDGNRLLTLLADDLGQAHFSYIPSEPLVVDTRNGNTSSLSTGDVLRPGEGYAILNESDTPVTWSGPFTVLAVDDVPDEAFYEAQELTGIAHSVLFGDEEDPQIAFQYIEMRDGTKLSVMVRFPDPGLYYPPYPTVIQYSGYAPSRPDGFGEAQQIANALGYATVGVNMRGTGCSGGVFDVFNRAQHADGYDIVEVVARQRWVLNNQVGMVGLSYPGISQLYVASTAPPSLAAVVPLSVIADPWEMQWPGGIYNSGFTRQWIDQRDQASAASGASWVVDQIAMGDTTCEENVRLSAQNIDFETFLRGLERRPEAAGDRDLNHLVEQIEAPVFLGGAWQDEQTGALFGGLTDRFAGSRATRLLLTNGRHPDGYAPFAVYRWWEFLELYVAERVPRMDELIRSIAADSIGGEFGLQDAEWEADRFADFADDDYDGVLAAYEAEPPVQLVLELGAGLAEQPGAPLPRASTTLPTWPPADKTVSTWHLGADGALLSAAAGGEGADTWRFDEAAGATTFFGPSGYQLLRPLWDIDWTHFAEGDVARYTSTPLQDDVVLAGPGIAELWINSPVDDVTVQVTLTEVRPDGIETLIQSGWLRVGHRANQRLHPERDDDLRLVRTYSEADYAPVPTDAWTLAEVVLPSFAHPLRAGSSLRVSVSSPGRNHGTWEFEPPDYGGEAPRFSLGWGGEHASRVLLSTLPGVEVPEGLPPCPSLRGQPCRADVELANQPE
jgi:predicted acyl esterase